MILIWTITVSRSSLWSVQRKRTTPPWQKYGHHMKAALVHLPVWCSLLAVRKQRRPASGFYDSSGSFVTKVSVKWTERQKRIIFFLGPDQLNQTSPNHGEQTQTSTWQYVDFWIYSINISYLLGSVPDTIRYKVSNRPNFKCKNVDRRMTSKHWRKHSGHQHYNHTNILVCFIQLYPIIRLPWLCVSYYRNKYRSYCKCRDKSLGL